MITSAGLYAEKDGVKPPIWLTLPSQHFPRPSWRSAWPMFPAAPRAEAAFGTYNDIFSPPGRLATVAAVARVLI
jgi:hypothetical protein